jgi:hypothetical protein
MSVVIVLLLGLLITSSCATRKSSEGGVVSAPAGGGATVQAVSPKGSVEVQLPGGGGWKTLDEGALLAEGARIRTAQGSGVDLVFTVNGSRFHLDAESAVTIERLLVRGDGDAAAVDVSFKLEGGQLTGKMVSQTMPSLFEIVTPDGNRLFYRPESGSSMEVAFAQFGLPGGADFRWGAAGNGSLTDPARLTLHMNQLAKPGEPTPPGPTPTIPEPGTFALLALGSLLLAGTAIRRR